ncbi:MarR family winged helix-turn-helix transcriptional regulator [Cetobacterium somerae]
MKDYLKLDLQLCFKFYKISRAILRAYQPLLNNLNLTYPQYLVMLVLWEHNNIYFSNLSKILDLKTGTLCPILKKMQDLELIEKEVPNDDCRKTIIKLTLTGKKLKEEAKDIPKLILKKLNLTENELKEINGTLKKLNF